MDKYFYTPHLEAIKKDFEDVKALGSACVEEWLKGLDPSRQDRIDDVERWERYEAKGGLKKLSSKPQPRTPFTIRPGALSNGACLEDMSSDRSTPQSFALPSRPDTAHGRSPSFLLGDYSHQYQNVSSKQNVIRGLVKLPTGPVLSKLTCAVSFPPSSTATTAAFDSKVQRQSNSLQPPRPERDVRDVNEAKAARQAEIERRCAALDPPLLLPILSHMESFQAALQITQPMTNNAWEVLKPRLLAQRSYAEKKENERLKQVKVLQAEAKQRRQQEVQLKETKEALDREWDIVQAPVRERISELADEIIESGWDGGKKITKETSPRFAAEVLLYVRDRFYADIAKEDEVARAAGQPLKVDAANAPPARKLILENMKRVFDTKIKPPTENFQKELFLCNGCEGNFKFYGFDSVIQHYAAKHTNTLSLGTIVVHWKAEWPEVPPFHPDPSASKAAYYKIPTPVGTSLPGLPGREPYLPQVYGYRQAGEPAYPVPQPSPGPYQPIYNGNHHESPYHSNQAQQYRPAPGPPPAPNYTLSTGLGYPIPPTGYMNGPPGYTGYSTSLQSQNSLGHPQRPPAHGNSGFPYRQDHPVPHQAPSNLSHGYGPPMTLPQSISYPPSMDSIIPAASHSSDLYQRQMDAMAKHARDVWFGTSGIKDIPQSVRIFVVIQHMVNRFKATFTNEPSLAMFIDGLDHNSVMRPVRSLNGLGCKTCVTSAPTDLNSLPAGDRRLYTLPHLLNHFRSAHLEVLQQTMITHSEHEILELDWKRDMIELPELPLIADLINAPGIDDKKLGLIAAVFPDAFPSPLPPMGLGRNVGPVASLRNSSKAVARVPQQASLGSLVSRQQQPLERRKFDQREKAHDPYRPLSPSTTSSEPAREDEYDPHRPAYLGKIVKFRTGSPNAQTSPGSSTPGTEPGFVNRFHVDGSSDWAQSDQSANRSSITMQSSKSQDQFDLRHALTEFQRHGTSPKEVQAFRSSSYVDEKHQTYKPPKIIQLSRIESLGSVQDAKAFPLSEEGEIKNGFPSHKTRSEEMSPQAEITEADRFLDSFDADTVPVQYPHQSTLESHAEPRFTQAVEDRDSLDGQHKDESKDASQWRPDSANVTSRNLEALARNSQISRSVSRNNRATPPHRLATGSRYDDRARSSSHLQIPLAESRISIRSPDRYADDVTPQESQHSRRDRETAGTDIPPRRSASYQIVPRVLEYHRRSRSPRQTSPETAYYRTRTPVEEYRPEKVIHIRSPSLRRDSRPPRVVSYDYAAESRFEYVDENGQPYRQRVEYVPVRFEERAPREPERYVIARPIQHSMPGYVQVEPGYEREHVCGDTPQTVRYPQSKQPHSGRSSASYVPEYKY